MCLFLCIIVSEHGLTCLCVVCCFWGCVLLVFCQWYVLFRVLANVVVLIWVCGCFFLLVVLLVFLPFCFARVGIVVVLRVFRVAFVYVFVFVVCVLCCFVLCVFVYAFLCITSVNHGLGCVCVLFCCLRCLLFVLVYDLFCFLCL